ncbi:MAG: prolipoprotein diacylglyceryl transferase family protein [Patescibacteria group bacterium]
MYYPILFKIGPVTFYSFGLFLTVGILSGVFLFWRRTRREGFNSERILDLSLMTLLCGIVGARLGFVLFNFSVFYSDPWDIFRSFNTGLSLAGGVLIGYLAFAFFVRRYEWSLLKLTDQLVFPFAFAYTLGKLALLTSGLSSSGSIWDPFLYFVVSGVLLIFEQSSLWGKARTYPRTGFLTFLSLFLFGAAFLGNTFLFWRSGVLFRVEQVMSVLAMVVGLYALVKKHYKDLQYLFLRLSSCFSGRPSTVEEEKSFLDVSKLRNWLFRESSEIEKEKKLVQEGDLFFRSGRENDNSEMGDEGQELLSHHYAEVITSFLDSFGVQIQKALHRLHIGEYGKCENCGKKISPERLDAYPAATLCIDCAREEEFPNSENN